MTTEFRILRESSEFDFPFSVIQRVWDELDTPYEPDPRLAELSPGQRAAYSMHWIFAEVCNGGFVQCFSNSTGYLLPEAIDGAQLFEAPQWTEVLTDAANTLGQPYPRDRDERNRRLDSLSSDQQATLDECDDRLYALDATAETSLTALTVRYINEHPDEFFVDAPDESAAAQALLGTARRAIDAQFGRDLDLAERLLGQALSRASSAGDSRTAALAQSLLDQVPFMRG